MSEKSFGEALAEAIQNQNEREAYKRENTVIVVRCQDCIHGKFVSDANFGICELHKQGIWQRAYCSMGERKDGKSAYDS